MNIRTRFLATALACLLLSACAAPNTPQDVTQAFWQSMLEGDADDAAELSTLVNEAAFDGYQRDWADVNVSWGRVVIDGDQASIATTLTGLPDGDQQPLETTTYLVRLDEQWLVDYHRTGDALSRGQLFDQMLHSLDQLSERFRARFGEQSSQAAIELERMAEALEKQMSLANDRLSILLEEYGRRLEESLEALSKSIEEALKEHPSATPDDKRTLNQAALRLNHQRRALAEPTLQDVAQGSHTLAETQLRLNRLGNEFADYQTRWRAQIEATQQDLAQLMSDI